MNNLDENNDNLIRSLSGVVDLLPSSQEISSADAAELSPTKDAKSASVEGAQEFLRSRSDLQGAFMLSSPASERNLDSLQSTIHGIHKSQIIRPPWSTSGDTDMTMPYDTAGLLSRSNSWTTGLENLLDHTLPPPDVTPLLKVCAEAQKTTVSPSDNFSDEIVKGINIISETLSQDEALVTALQTSMYRYFEELQLDPQTRSLATHIGNEAVKKNLCQRRNSASLSAAAVYLACILQGRRTTQHEFCARINLTEVTLRKVYKELSNHWPQLIPGGYHPKMIPNALKKLQDKLNEKTSTASDSRALKRRAVDPSPSLFQADVDNNESDDPQRNIRADDEGSTESLQLPKFVPPGFSNMVGFPGVLVPKISTVVSIIAPVFVFWTTTTPNRIV